MKVGAFINGLLCFFKKVREGAFKLSDNFIKTKLLVQLSGQSDRLVRVL